jgi:alpha-ketoglutarate-dependent taurine dioxygenase
VGHPTQPSRDGTTILRPGATRETGERPLVLAGKLVSQSREAAAQLDCTVRRRWAEDDVAIWDNRATQRNAISGYGDQPGVVRRVTVVGVEGRRSVARSEAGKPVAVTG